MVPAAGAGWHAPPVDDALPLLGFGLPVSGSWARPATMLRLARRAEELDYHSLWTFQRLLVPAEGTIDPAWDERNNPAVRSADDPSYRSVHDPLLPLAYVAGHTSRIRLGTATICALFTPPAVLATALTTADHLTGGRLDVGLGIGWLPHEYVAAGVPQKRRGARFEEYLRVLEALWTEDPVEHHGEFYDVPRSHPGPMPMQRPRPPLLLGGSAPAALRRAGRVADGWIASSRQDLGRIEESIGLVRAGAEEAGRDPAAVRVLVRALVDLRERPVDRREPLQGCVEQVREDLVALRRRGVSEVFVDLNFSPRVGSPDADPDAAEGHALELLEALAPHALG